MPSRRQHSDRQRAPFDKESSQRFAFLFIQRREAWKRRTLAAIERRRNSPHSAIPVGPLFNLVEVVFLHAVRGIGDDGLNAALRDSTHPLKAIRVNDERAGA